MIQIANQCGYAGHVKQRLKLKAASH